MIRLNQITPQIYELIFSLDELMFQHLLRYSQFIEAAGKKFYKKDFTYAQVLVDYKKQTGVDYKDVFTAFNFPSHKLKEAFSGLSNFSAQEVFIQDIVRYLDGLSKGEFRYLLGTSEEDGTDSREHELAHAFYGTDELYKEQMNCLIDDLPTRVRDAMINYLSKSQYHSDTYKDEIQSYMATGLDEMDKSELVSKYRVPFMEVYREKVKEVHA